MRTSRLPVVAAVIAAAVATMLLAVNPAHAQAQPSAAELQREIDQLQAKLNALQALDQKVQVLDQRVDTEQQDTKQKFLDLPKVKADANGITVGSPDGDFNLRVHGLIQADGQFYSNGDDKKAPGGVTSSTFLINRARAIFDGTVFKNYDYHLSRTSGSARPSCRTPGSTRIRSATRSASRPASSRRRTVSSACNRILICYLSSAV